MTVTAPARPRDVLVLVDMSASQAGRPIAQARQIITALTADAGPNDRFAVWTLSTPAATKSLTQGLQPGNSEDIRQATATLAELSPGEVWITHGREEGLLRWCELRGQPARALALVGYEDEEET